MKRLDHLRAAAVLVVGLGLTLVSPASRAADCGGFAAQWPLCQWRTEVSPSGLPGKPQIKPSGVTKKAPVGTQPKPARTPERSSHISAEPTQVRAAKPHTVPKQSSVVSECKRYNVSHYELRTVNNWILVKVPVRYLGVASFASPPLLNFPRTFYRTEMRPVEVQKPVDVDRVEQECVAEFFLDRFRAAHLMNQHVEVYDLNKRLVFNSSVSCLRSDDWPENQNVQCTFSKAGIDDCSNDALFMVRQLGREVVCVNPGVHLPFVALTYGRH